MLRGGLRIGRLLGIDVVIHASWLIILFAVAWSLAATVFPDQYDWAPATYWAVGIVSAFLLFLSVLVHEFAHSLVARAQGIPVKNITLFVLGGVSQIEEEPASPGREALLAGIGPAASVLIGIVCLALSTISALPETVGATLFYLGAVNILLAVFNLLPGFPLDGGRVLRAVLWARSGDLARATQLAARSGHAFGYALIVLGVALAFSGSIFGGLWTGFVGWALTQAAQASYARTLTERRLAGVTARMLMSAPRGAVPPDITLRKAANEYFLALNARCLPVYGDDGYEGLVCLSDLQRADPRQWAVDQVQDVMTARADVATIAPDAPAAEALELLARRDVNQLAVMDGAVLLGFVDRAAVMNYLEISGALAADRSAPRR